MVSGSMLKNPGEEMMIFRGEPELIIKKHRARSGVFCCVSKNCGELFETLIVWSKWKDQWIKF